MTESTPTVPNPLQDNSSPLTFGAASYAAVLRSQVEMTMQLTVAWAAAVSAMSSRMLAVRPSGGSAAGPPSDTWSNRFQGLRSVREVGADRNPPSEQPAADFTWSRPVFDQPAKGGMLRWLTEPPTLQNNLFDETIELLVDEDIKTAS